MYVAVQSTIICFTQVQEAVVEQEVKGSFPVMQLCVGCAPPHPHPPTPRHLHLKQVGQLQRGIWWNWKLLGLVFDSVSPHFSC